MTPMRSDTITSMADDPDVLREVPWPLRVARVALVVIGIASCVAPVVVVAFADLQGNTRSRQILAAVISLPLWAVVGSLVWRQAFARVSIACVGTAICVAGALLVISDPSLKGDGLGAIDYIGIPLILIAVENAILRQLKRPGVIA